MSSHIHLKIKAISLRRKGKSYNQIIKLLGIKSKGTLNSWFKNLVLSEKSKLLLSKNNKIAYSRGLFSANKIRRDKINAENFDSFVSGEKSIHPLSMYELRLIGATLYWGEGTKSQKSASPSLVFSNSDPLMISVYMRFVRKILQVKEEKIRAGIHLYPSIPISDARIFWSKVTGLPIERFYIVNQISQASKRKRPRNSLPFGTAVIKINSRVQFHKVKGMMSGVAKRARI